MKMPDDKLKKIIQQGRSFKHWIQNQPDLLYFKRSKMVQYFQIFLKDIWEYVGIKDVEQIKANIIEYFPKQTDENNEKWICLSNNENLQRQVSKQKKESQKLKQIQWILPNKQEKHKQLQKEEQKPKSNQSSFLLGNDEYQQESKAQRADMSISLSLQQCVLEDWNDVKATSVQLQSDLEQKLFDLSSDNQVLQKNRTVLINKNQSQRSDDLSKKGILQTFSTKYSSICLIEKSFMSREILPNKFQGKNKISSEQLQEKRQHYGFNQKRVSQWNVCRQKETKIEKAESRKKSPNKLMRYQWRIANIQRNIAQENNTQQINKTREELQKIDSSFRVSTSQEKLA